MQKYNNLKNKNKTPALSTRSINFMTILLDVNVNKYELFPKKTYVSYCSPREFCTIRIKRERKLMSPHCCLIIIKKFQKFIDIVKRCRPFQYSYANLMTTSIRFPNYGMTRNVNVCNFSRFIWLFVNNF